MRWPWSPWWQLRHTKELPPETPQADLPAAQEAEQQRKEERREQVELNIQITRLTRDLLRHSEDNHFSEWVVEAMKRKT